MDFYPKALQIIKNITNPAWAEEIRGKLKDHSQNVEYYGGAFEKEDHGTAHISVLDAQENAATMTTTVNYIFGSKRISTSTGILLNDEMDDFSQPNQSNVYGLAPSPSNFIQPGKRPQSSMSPTIVIDRKTGDVKLVVGAAGGSKIISTVAYVILRTMWLNETIKQAIDAPRLHNQLLPYVTNYESGFPEIFVNLLNQTFGQNMSKIDAIAAATGIHVDKDEAITATTDWRKIGGYSAGF